VEARVKVVRAAGVTVEALVEALAAALAAAMGEETVAATVAAQVVATEAEATAVAGEVERARTPDVVLVEARFCREGHAGVATAAEGGLVE